MLSGSFHFTSTSGTASVCTLRVHRGWTLTALLIFSVSQWLQAVPYLHYDSNNHISSSRKTQYVSLCTHPYHLHSLLHEKIIKMVDEKIIKMVAHNLICSLLPAQVILKTEKNLNYIYLSPQTVRQHQSQV